MVYGNVILFLKKYFYQFLSQNLTTSNTEQCQIPDSPREECLIRVCSLTTVL